MHWVPFGWLMAWVRAPRRLPRSHPAFEARDVLRQRLAEIDRDPTLEPREARERKAALYATRRRAP